MPGPNRTPTAKLKLTGSSLAPKRERQNEPKPSSAPPEVPEWIASDPQALELWDGTIERLVCMGLASHTDSRALERYIRDLIKWHAMRVFIDSQPESMAYAVKDRNDRVCAVHPIPQVKIINDLSDRLLKMEREFGLTPSARASLTTNATPINDERGSFLDRKRPSTV